MTMLDTRTKRDELKPRKKGYFHTLERGIAIGYERTKTGGRWVVRVERNGERWQKRIPLVTDDYGLACDAAKNLAKGENHDTVTDNGKPSTVAEAIVDFEGDLIRRGGNPAQTRRLYRRNDKGERIGGIVPADLLAKPVALLTRKECRRFRDGLAKTMPKLVSVNRTLKPLRAALARAAELDERIKNSDAWRIGFKAYPDPHVSKNADAVWEADEPARFIKAAAALEKNGKFEKNRKQFALFAETKFGTGMRFISLLRLEVRDLLPDDTLDMPRSKKGKDRQTIIEREPVAILPDLMKRLREHAAGRALHEPLLVRADGTPWNYSHVRTLWDETMAAAKIKRKKGVVTTAARHTSITRMLLSGKADPVLIVAAHDTSLLMVQRHYAEKITKHGQALLRAARMDLAPPSDRPPPKGANVVPMRKRA